MDPREREHRNRELQTLRETVLAILQGNLANPEARAANQKVFDDAQKRIRLVEGLLAAPVAAPVPPAAAPVPAEAAAAATSVRVHETPPPALSRSERSSFSGTAPPARRLLSRRAGGIAGAAVTDLAFMCQRVHERTTTQLFRGRCLEVSVIVKVPRGRWLNDEIAGVALVGACMGTNSIMQVDRMEVVLPGDTEPVTAFVSREYRSTALSLRDNHDYTRIAHMMGRMVVALQTLHDSGLIHSDVKPSNIFLDPTIAGTSNVVLGDFGGVVRVGSHRNTVSPGFVIDEWAGAAAHPQMDWASLVLTGLALLRRDLDEEVSFERMKAEVESLRLEIVHPHSDADVAKQAIIEVFDHAFPGGVSSV